MSTQDPHPPLPTGAHKPEAMALIRQVLDFIGDRPLDGALEFELNRRFGPYGAFHDRLATLMRTGVAEGWAGYAPVEGAGYSRGRIAHEAEDTRGMRVESGLMRDVVGQHHRHTRGEIDLVIPLDPQARWCGHGAGWVVYPAGSEHFPTTEGGQALILFFLPGGEIDYRPPPAELAGDRFAAQAAHAAGPAHRP